MRKLGLIISLVLISQQITWSQTKVCVDKIRNFYELLETKVSEVNAEQPFK